jgi:DeoR/GlpR family transcriptional regulator of sugar metabolism
MLPLERRQEIVNLVNDSQGCSVEELASEFGVSETTIRRDLQELSEQNLIERTRGGAMPTVSRGKDYDNRKIHNLEAKAAIGAQAVDEIHQEEIVIFDCGTTTFEIAKQVSTDQSFVPMTPMPLIGRELAQKGFETHVTGGLYRPENYTAVGPWAEKFIQQTNADLFFLGTDGIDTDGLTARNVHQHRLKELMIENAKRTVLVSDHTKFGDNHTFRFAGLDAVDLFITDREIPVDIREAFRSAGVDLVENTDSG